MQSGTDQSQEGESLSLYRFVREVKLPHRAEVTEGYCEVGDTDGSRDFSCGDIIEVRRVICPLITLRYQDPVSQKVIRVSVTTQKPDVRFHVLTRKEMTPSAKPRHFRLVQELIDFWPHMIKCLADHIILCSSYGNGPKSIMIQKDDDLRLIRMIYDGKGGSLLECRVQSTSQLIQLPPSYAGSFVEVPDRLSYTLRELVDIAWVERHLRVDNTLEGQPPLPNGIPRNYIGVIVMEKPEVLAEIGRFLGDEDKLKEVDSPPMLVPIDCDIRISPRDEDRYNYILQNTLPNDAHSLLEFVTEADHLFPVVARIVGWTEQSGILMNHVTSPGDHVILYARTFVDKVLAHGGGKYFLIPTSHAGRFLRIHGKTREPTEVKLNTLGSASFPFNVQYCSTDTYANMRDGLPSSEMLTLRAFIKRDPCVLVSKLFGDVIGDGFSLPLNTVQITIRIQLLWRMKNGAKSPPMMSLFDHCSEEISSSAYDRYMKSSSYEWIPASSDWTNNRNSGTAPPPIPPRIKKPSTSNDHTTLPLRSSREVRKLPQQPIPKHKLQSGEDEDENYYSCIDADDLEAESTKHGGVVIPSNGNICHFTVDQMLFFLKENNFPFRTISSWEKNRIDGNIFAKMSDEELARHGVGTPVIRFFRDRSKMKIVSKQ